MDAKTKIVILTMTILLYQLDSLVLNPERICVPPFYINTYHFYFLLILFNTSYEDRNYPHDLMESVVANSNLSARLGSPNCSYTCTFPLVSEESENNKCKPWQFAA